MSRILIVAPYASVRAGLHALLGENDDCSVIGEVSGSEELEHLLPAASPDVVLLDDNADELAHVLEALTDSEIGLVVLSDSDRAIPLLAGSLLPGWALLRKEAGGQEIAGAVRAAAAGLIALDRTRAPLLAAAVNQTRNADAEPLYPGEESLTAREREVLQRLAQGLPNKIIAARLHISLSTVKFHVASILTKLSASSRTEAVTLGARRGLISL